MENVAWYEHCVLRDDVRQGKLAVAEFAADLYSVRTGNAPNVYQLANLFFDRTYPTYNLKMLVRKVFRRLSGRGGEPVIRVQVAYGGGKTHALIALMHLAERSNQLALHSTVQEFVEFTGVEKLPRARVALLPFDKFDVKEGLLVVDTNGEKRQIRTPWGALAYQLAGDEGLERIAEHDRDYVPPAELVLVDLLKAPQQAEDLSTLILMDETLWYMRNAVNDDPHRLEILQDFFQVLTQAVDKVDRAALVASLISYDMVSNHPTGVQVLNALNRVFDRLAVTIEPVPPGDVSELLRRRLFEPLKDTETYRPVIDHLVNGIQKLPVRSSQKGRNAYNRLLKSYPFHPDLLEVFHQKWTQLSEFRRTRGILRMFALALKASVGKTKSVLIGPESLLETDGSLSEAIRELIAACEEGNKWSPILSGELEKAREIQNDLPRLKQREIEVAVVSSFLHSQPLGQKADVTDLYAFLAHPDVDRMSVEEGLSKWRKESWFLKEDDQDTWCLETTPNLTNMLVHEMERVTEDRIDDDLEQRIRGAKLDENADGVTVNTLPNSPADIPDNPELHFVIARPEHSASPGQAVSPEFQRFFERTYRNSIIVLAPESSQLDGLRDRICKILAWQDIGTGDAMDLLNERQQADLLKHRQAAESGMLDSVRSAYSVLIAVDEDGGIKARLLSTGKASPFERAKVLLEKEDRVLTTPLDPNLLASDSDLELWRDGETSKPVRELYRMFAILPRLPRLLSRRVFVDTLRRGVKKGRIVLRDVRPNGSQHTYWRQSPSDDDLSKKGLEIVPVEHAELHELEAELLCPDVLWQSGDYPLKVSAILDYFNGEEAPKLASDEILFGAVKSAVEARFVMGRAGGEDYIGEDIAHATIDAEWEVLPPPAAIRGSEIAPNTLPDAWEGGVSTVGKVRDELSNQKGAKPPWALIKDAVNQGVANQLFEITTDNWPCSAQEADRVGLRESKEPMRLDPREIATATLDTSGSVTLGWIKEALESKKGVSIPDDVFRPVAAEALNRKLIVTDGPPVDDYYETYVRQPDWVRYSESRLTESEVQDLAGRIGSLSEIAPELEFEFRLVVTAEGERPSNEVLEHLNDILGGVAESLKFDSDDS